MSSSKSESAQSSSTKEVSDTTVSISRRRLLKGGAAAGPLGLAIVTRPARATGQLCQSPSAFGSMHSSRPTDEQPICTGRTPGYWKQPQHFSEWPAPYLPTDQPGLIGSATLFHGAGFLGHHFDGETLLDVMKEGGNALGIVALGRHVAAALLNAASGKTAVLPVHTVLGIWNDFVANGYYEPTAGVHWDEEQIVVYLKSTMPV